MYFNPESRKIMAVGPQSADPGPPWKKFDDNHLLGLLAARQELEGLGLVDEAGDVDWQGMSRADSEYRGQVSHLIRAFRDDSERLRLGAANKEEARRSWPEALRRGLSDSTQG
jgi:hypothetical protein